MRSHTLPDAMNAMKAMKAMSTTLLWGQKAATRLRKEKRVRGRSF
jgi:hypothetical protein